jgi:hypothetical protein
MPRNGIPIGIGAWLMASKSVSYQRKRSTRATSRQECYCYSRKKRQYKRDQRAIQNLEKR